VTRASAIVIGAGPGGCSAAVHLARRGWRVSLVEKAAFPRVKVCGEFVSPAATAWLESLLSPAALRELGARRVRDLVLEMRGEGDASFEREVRWRMPGGGRSANDGDAGGAWVLSRAALDTALVGAAREAGVEVLQPAAAQRATYAADGAAVEIDGVWHHADIVVHADGFARLDVDEAHQVSAQGRDARARTRTMRAGVVGHKCHLRVPTGVLSGGAALRMRAARGAYVGMVGVENQMATVALVARRELIAACGGDADVMLSRLWRAYRPEWRCSAWLACGVAHGGYQAGCHARSWRVGNAAGAVEPVGGEGIGLALWSGAKLADVLGDSMLGEAPDMMSRLERARRDYARAYRARLRWRRPACRLAAEALMRPWIVRAVWPILERAWLRGAVLTPWYAMTGKPV
jgi:menaquinone-9 beta-reductase